MLPKLRFCKKSLDKTTDAMSSVNLPQSLKEQQEENASNINEMLAQAEAADDDDACAEFPFTKKDISRAIAEATKADQALAAVLRAEAKAAKKV